MPIVREGLERLNFRFQPWRISKWFGELLFILFFNWSTIALQCCVSFCCTKTWISYMYIYISPPSGASLSLPPRSSRSSQSTRLGSLCYTETSHKLSTVQMVVYIYQCYVLNSSHPVFLLLCAQGHSLHLCLHSFPANRFISTIFLDSLYMH